MDIPKVVVRSHGVVDVVSGHRRVRMQPMTGAGTVISVKGRVWDGGTYETSITVYPGEEASAICDYLSSGADMVPNIGEGVVDE